MFKFILCVTLSAILVTVSGCAYRFGSQGRALPGGYGTVAVPVFKNKTGETGIETYFTNAMARELARSKVARMTDEAQAQVMLDGQIESLQYVVAAPSSRGGLPQGTALTTEYRILVSTRLEIRRMSDRALLWSTVVTGERSYTAPRIGLSGLNSANALYNQSARHQTIELVAQDMMAEAHDRMTENF